jgi:hypothetical protein
LLGDYRGGEKSNSSRNRSRRFHRGRDCEKGFTLFVGRRNGDKLAPLIKEIETGGGRSLDARKEEEIVSFLSDADKQAPLAVCVLTSAPT